MGWWEPVARGRAGALLRAARLDAEPDVRRAALAALARLGDCHALQFLRDALARQNPVAVIDAIQTCAAEGLSWLWPELDQLTESDDAVVAAQAWDALERLRERVLGPLA